MRTIQGFFGNRIREKSFKEKICYVFAGGLILLILVSLFFFLLLRRPFYSEDDIKNQLRERYNLTFSIGKLVSQSEKPRRRIYQLYIEEYPDLECYVVDNWVSSGWSGGKNGVPPIFTFPKHQVWDSCKAASWNQYAVPLLEEYGIYGLEIEEEDQFYGVSVSSRYEKDARYTVNIEDNLEQQAERLYTLMEKLRQQPVFCDIISDWDSRDYPIPVRIFVGERHTTFDLILTKHLTKEDILRALSDRFSTIY